MREYNSKMYNNNRINKFFIQLKINEEVSPGIEPGSEDSKSSMLTDYTTKPNSQQPDSNQWPKELQSFALPTELY